MGHLGSISPEAEWGQTPGVLQDWEGRGRQEVHAALWLLPHPNPLICSHQPLSKHRACWCLGACHPVSGFVRRDVAVNWPFMWGSGSICSGFPEWRLGLSPWARLLPELRRLGVEAGQTVGSSSSFPALSHPDPLPSSAHTPSPCSLPSLRFILVSLCSFFSVLLSPECSPLKPTQT